MDAQGLVGLIAAADDVGPPLDQLCHVLMVNRHDATRVDRDNGSGVPEVESVPVVVHEDGQPLPGARRFERPHPGSMRPGAAGVERRPRILK